MQNSSFTYHSSFCNRPKAVDENIAGDIHWRACKTNELCVNLAEGVQHFCIKCALTLLSWIPLKTLLFRLCTVARLQRIDMYCVCKFCDISEFLPSFFFSVLFLISSPCLWQGTSSVVLNAAGGTRVRLRSHACLIPFCLIKKCKSIAHISRLQS